MRIRVVESETGTLHGDHIVDRRAGEQFVAAIVDEEFDAILLDHGVIGIGLPDEAHFVLITRASAGIDHDP